MAQGERETVQYLPYPQAQYRLLRRDPGTLSRSGFAGFEPVHEAATFYVPQSEEEIRAMYEDLVKYGYIAPETTFEAFGSIFDKARFESPVEWTKTQRQLSYFIHQAFSRFNRKNLWIKGECCFRIGGKKPHKASLVTGFAWIKRAGWMDRYDTRLKAICDRFNQ